MNHIFLQAGLLLGAAFPFSASAAGLVETPRITITNGPDIQMLVPGFTFRELPLELNNLNSFAYAPDGRLFALAYDGNVFQLVDTDGDGLEDKATRFYANDRNEIRPSIGMTWGPGGLYIASQGRIIRLKDKGDGTGELETITGGWVGPAVAAGSSLDAIGIAVDPAGDIYFGLGCDDYRGAYRVNKETGKSDYSLKSDRGTIQKVSPDWQHREIVATGVRFTVSLAFNAEGDLFCTDQEGATWLPNGNPLDELLQITAGRHYGFPPRHPTYLPGVIDEPSVFDYGPQHQSTCGLHFNNPVANGSAIFGPAWWRGDALVAGESRGKLWRTKLVKTSVGYVAQNQLIACLKMMTIDAIPTPQGDVLICCHSGKPDWGTGPGGKGRLFKIFYANKQAPQPVFAYAVGPTETRIIFDRPLDPANLKNLAQRSSITAGRYVMAGDRFETFRPGYQAVKDQEEVPQYSLAVLSAGVSGDNRSLILQSAPRTRAMNYAVTIANPERPFVKEPASQATGWNPEIDLLTDLTGVEASWTAARGKESWQGWLPHLDLAVARAITAPSAEHAQAFNTFQRPGKLALRTQLNLGLMLHPVTQPGAKLDYEYPPEIVTVILKGGAALKVTAGASAKLQKISDQETRLTVTPKPDQWLPVEVVLATGNGEPKLEISWFTDEDPRPRAMPLRRFLLPWATPEAAQVFSDAPRTIPEIAGGDWERGKKVFFSEPAVCFKCHQAGGEGGKIGPDLSNLTQRDYASVLRDITQPSAAINPDHLAYVVELKNGESVTGVILEDTLSKLVLGQVTGSSLTLEKAQIDHMKASSLSLMPEGLLQALKPAQQKDLLTFLLMEKPGGK